MLVQRIITRYAAYFRGWCQAFGEHESITGEENGVSWLLADQQIGFILPQQVTKPLNREMLWQNPTPTLVINSKHLEVGALRIPLTGWYDSRGLNALETLLRTGNEFHFFLTSHFMYGTGTRILTLSTRKPLAIIYKEIGTMYIRME
ncbi:MAG TPA: hypothetical protein VET88_00675 [Gammaproteobacteria bacterium]|nr:hypothetical protein [Gammaproteobacteria bacterium]